MKMDIIAQRGPSVNGLHLDMYFAITSDRRKDIDQILKNGFVFMDTSEEEKNGGPVVILPTTIPEAVAVYSQIYNTKEKGIKTLTVFEVIIPPDVEIWEDVDVNPPTPDGEPVQCFMFRGEIKPEWIIGYSVCDLKAGGLYA